MEGAALNIPPQPSPGGTQVNRHEPIALRLQSLSSVAFEGGSYLATRTGQTRLVIAPQTFGTTCGQRALRLLLELPPRDQILTGFVNLDDNRQHRRSSVHFRLLISSSQARHHMGSRNVPGSTR